MVLRVDQVLHSYLSAVEKIVKVLLWKVCPNFWLVMHKCVYSQMFLGEKVRWGSNLQVGHWHTVQHVVAGLLDGTEQVVEGPNVDAWLLVRSQHGVGLPTTCRQGETALLEGPTSREHSSSSFSEWTVSVRLQGGDTLFAKTHRSLNLPFVMSQWAGSVPAPSQMLALLCVCYVASIRLQTTGWSNTISFSRRSKTEGFNFIGWWGMKCTYAPLL